jgi:hypothetical protein
MKVVKAFVLALAVSVCAYAGEMDNGVAQPPPSQPATVAQEPTTDGIMQNGVADGIIPNDAATTFMQVMLNLLALP